MSRSLLLIASGLVALAVGCSNSQPSSKAADTASAPSGASSTSPATVSRAPAADFRQLAECVAKVEAVSRLYSAVASQSSDAQAAEMNSLASQRSLAAFDLRAKAEDMERAALPAGSAGSQVPQIIRETETALENERASRPFEEFAIWVAQESDRCAALLPAQT